MPNETTLSVARARSNKPLEHDQNAVRNLAHALLRQQGIRPEGCEWVIALCDDVTVPHHEAAMEAFVVENLPAVQDAHRSGLALLKALDERLIQRLFDGYHLA